MNNPTEGNEVYLISKVKYLNAKVLMVSNRSYYPRFQLGTSVWVITTKQSWKHLIFSDNLIPEQKPIQCFYRSELGGTYRSYLLLE